MLNLLIFVVVVGLLVWLVSLLPIPAPFNQIVMVLGIIIVVIACLQFLFGIDLLGHIRGSLR
jgi:hypothetical protein